jgi:hypothetical protein
MHINTHHCRACGCTEQFSTLYEVWVLPKTPTTRQLKPRMSVLPLKDDLHVAYINMRERTIPICSDCVSTYRRAADQSPLPEADPGQWAETIRRKYAPEPRVPRLATRVTNPKAIPSIEDL